MTISFARHQFPPAIIRHAVWLYVRFHAQPSRRRRSPRGAWSGYLLRNGAAMRIEVRAVVRPRTSSTPTANIALASRWHLDEMAVTIAGQQFWLWRAVDDEGEVLDLLVQRRRDKVKLMRKLLKKQASHRLCW